MANSGGNDKSQLDSEMVELRLVYQGEGPVRLLLEGEDARKARQKIGGEWPLNHHVTVCFDKNGKIEIRR